MNSSTISLKKPEKYGYGTPAYLADKPDFINGFESISIPNAWVQLYKNVVLKIDEKKMIMHPYSNGTWAAGLAKPNEEEKSYSFKNVVWLVDGAYNYVHFLHAIVPRFDLLKEANLIGEDTVYIVENYRSYRKEIIEERIGISPSQIFELQNKTTFECENCILASRPIEIPHSYPTWAVEYLRQLFSGEVQTKGNKRIYISRADATKRRVNNEQEVTELLSNYGFESYTLEAMTVAEQVELFASSEAIIAPHGANMGNLIFCNSGTKVIEIFNPYYTPSMYYGLARKMNCVYRAIFSENHGFIIPGETTIPFEVAQSINIDVNLQKLKSTIDEMGL
jgi:capsular polysaccharide biosynthesis protein